MCGCRGGVSSLVSVGTIGRAGRAGLNNAAGPAVSRRQSARIPPMPNLVVIAGPDGIGTSTATPDLLRGPLGIDEFVNADVIARGLSAFDPEGAAVEAGRVMLRGVRELARQRGDFAFETTLVGRAFAPWIAGLIEGGYVFRLAGVDRPSEA